MVAVGVTDNRRRVMNRLHRNNLSAQPIANSVASQTTWNGLSGSAIAKIGDRIKL